MENNLVLIVEDGSIIESANTYVDLKFVDDYLFLIGEEGWFELDQKQRIQRVIKARYILDRFYNFKGDKVDKQHHMEWPRKNIINVESNKIPIEIKEAQCEICLLTEDVYLNIDTNISKIKAGPVEIDYGASMDLKNYKRHTRIEDIIRNYITKISSRFSVKNINRV